MTLSDPVIFIDSICHVLWLIVGVACLIWRHVVPVSLFPAVHRDYS